MFLIDENDACQQLLCLRWLLIPVRAAIICRQQRSFIADSRANFFICEGDRVKMRANGRLLHVPGIAAVFGRDDDAVSSNSPAMQSVIGRERDTEEMVLDARRLKPPAIAAICCRQHRPARADDDRASL